MSVVDETMLVDVDNEHVGRAAVLGQLALAAAHQADDVWRGRVAHFD